MKRKIVPFGLSVIINLVLMAAAIGLGIYEGINFTMEEHDVLQLVLLGILLIITLVYVIKTWVYYKVYYDDDEIWMRSDKAINKNNLIQREVSISFSEITAINWIDTSTDSDGEGGKKRKRMNLFLEFSCKGSGNKRIYTSRLSKIQFDRLVKVIEQKTGLTVNTTITHR